MNTRPGLPRVPHSTMLIGHPDTSTVRRRRSVARALVNHLGAFTAARPKPAPRAAARPRRRPPGPRPAPRRGGGLAGGVGVAVPPATQVAHDELPTPESDRHLGG